MKKLLPFLVLVFCFVAAGQTSKPQGIQRNPNINWQAAPRGWTGDDFLEVYHYLITSKETGPKDEFETTDEFDRRTRDPNLIFKDGRSVKDTFAFLYPSRRGFFNKTLYNADSGYFTIELSISHQRAFSFANRFQNFLTLNTKNPLVSSHPPIEARTEYGLKYPAKYSEITYFQIGIMNADDLNLSPTMPHVSIELRIEREEARRVKDELVVAFFVKPVFPFAASGTTTVNPTRENPEKIEANSWILPVELLDVWVFNAETGEIYFRNFLKARSRSSLHIK